MHAILTQEELEALRLVMSNGAGSSLRKSNSSPRRRANVLLAERKRLPEMTKVASLREILSRSEIAALFSLFRKDGSLKDR
jgi:hypothetical protein